MGAAVLSNANVAPLRLKQRFQMVSVVADINALPMAARADLDTARRATAPGDTHA